jgi:2-keto-4-pentenoate hydratase/2-oxohepta-3-ene-1,7-dioic acid hydratase in catechol pathway
MKIICIGRNYVDHIHELQNAIPEDPVIFQKPDTALLKEGTAFYLYYDQVGIGIDFTARDLQSKLKAKGLPWELAKAFDGSAPISEFVPKSDFANLQDLNFHLEVNGQTRQQGNTSLMLFKIDYMIAFMSRFFTLKTGDLIFTGTPKGVGPVKVGDTLTAYIEGKKMLEFEVK